MVVLKALKPMEINLLVKEGVGIIDAWQDQSWHSVGGKPPLLWTFFVPQISDVKLTLLQIALIWPDIFMEASIMTPRFLTVVDAGMETPPSFRCISGKLLEVRGVAITMNSFFFLIQLQHILSHPAVYFGHAGCKHTKDSFTVTRDLRIKITKQLGVISISIEQMLWALIISPIECVYMIKPCGPTIGPCGTEYWEYVVVT